MHVRIAALVVLSLGIAARADAQFRVEGIVRQADGTPLAGVTVVATGLELKQTFETKTDDRGMFVFPDIRPGGWVRLTASREGSILATQGALVTRGLERVDLDEPGRPMPVPPVPARRDRAAASSFGQPPPDLPAVGPPTAAPSPAPPVPPPAPTVNVVRLSGSGGVRGTVRSPDGLGLPGVVVGIDGTDTFAIADTEGNYSLVGLPVGSHLTVVASLDGFETVRSEVDVRGGVPGSADFVLPLAALSERVDVRSEVPLLNASAGVSRVTLRPEQVAALPSLGERDIFRALQLLPGVSGTQEASSGLYVRGGTPDQNLVTLDGFTLYHVDHLFGYFSAFNMDALDQVEFAKGPFRAADGGRLSGTLRLAGKAGEIAKPSAFLNVSMLSTSGLVSVPLGTRGTVLVAGRRSYQSGLYNKILGLVDNSGARGPRPAGPSPFGGNDPFASTPASWFYDLNGKAQFNLSAADSLSAAVYDGRDDVDNSRTLDLGAANFPRFGSATGGLGLPADPVLNLNEVQRWTNRGAGLTWKHQWTPESVTTVSAGSSTYRGVRDFASSLTSKSTGEDYSFASGRGGSRGDSDTNVVRDLSLRVDHALTRFRGHRVSMGVESTRLEVDYDSQTAAVQANGPGGGVASALVGLLTQANSAQLIAGYVADVWTPLARLLINPGVRMSRYDLTGENFVEPRLVANYQLTSQLQFKVGYGLAHQVIGRIQFEDLSQGDREFWSLSDGQSIKVPSVRQAMAGASYETAGFLVDVEAYDKQMERLTLFAPRLTIGVAPGEGQSYLYEGSGRAQGIEVLVQKKFGRNTGWASYTQSVAEQLFPDLDANYFLASQDQNYEFKLADTMKLGSRWTMGATWMFGSGRPFTPATGVESVSLPFGGLTVDRIVYGPKNSSRLPPYHRLDLSLEGKFRMLGLQTTVGVTGFNIYDRQNVWYRTYQTFGGAGTINDVTLMGRAINPFMRVGL